MSVRGSIVAGVAGLVALVVLGFCGVALAAGPPSVDSEGSSGVGPFGATLEAQVNPGEQETTCVRFEYGTSTAYGSSAPCANGSLGSGGEDTPASAVIAGLRQGTEYHFRVVVENLSSPLGGTVGPDQTFTTPLVIGGEESFSEVTERGAALSAPVNAGGVPTTYYFQYGPSAAYGSQTSGATLSGDEAVSATARLVGLASDGEYHFRIVTESENGVSEVGADMVFRTLPVGVQGLPDGRVYEMVTPPENQDANVDAPRAFSGFAYEYTEVYGIPSKHPFRAAADGDAVVYNAEPTSPGGEGRRGFDGGDDYLATRSAGGGWTQANLQPLGNEGAEYWSFSSDLSVGVLTAGGHDTTGTPPPLAADAPGGVSVPYVRLTGQDAYSPLFTTTPPNESGNSFHTRYAGASADFSHLLFEANDALSPEAVNGGKSENNLYVSAGGSLSAVNILPGATSSEPNAVFGAPVAGTEEWESSESPDFSHDISADGSRIFWTDLNAGVDEDHIFVRVNGASTVAVSAGAARFWAASTDGRYAFYVEGEQLLRFDGDSGAREVLAGVGAEVQGVLGASEDGSYIYFVADGVLAAGAQPGQPNLYLLHSSGGGWEALQLIATLQPGDGNGLGLGWRGPSNPAGAGDWETGLAYRTAEVTPDGQGLVFMSRASLPAVGFPHGYDNDGLGEVYVYQAGGGGRLSCVSCNPSGEPPQSGSIEGVASFLPIEFAPTYQPRWISENGGRVFFDSFEPLVARDTNGLLDAYEWERDGEGSCTQPNGCIYLLSSGTGGTASYFVDASTNGDDAFIVDSNRLVPQDQNENADLYDVRVGGVNALAPAEGCAGAGCQAPAATPSSAGAPASTTFAGAGNLAPPVAPVAKAPVKTKAKTLSRAQKLARALKVCMSGPRRRRAACERQARRLYGPKVKARRTGVSMRSTGGGRS